MYYTRTRPVLWEVAVPVWSPSVAFCCTVFTAMASRAASDCTGTSAVRHRESESSLPPSQHSVQSKHTNHLMSVVFRNSPAVTWDFDCHKLSILLILVQKYDSYKQCLLRRLPSCTKPFRGLYGEKRERRILHKIIPTGERKYFVCRVTGVMIIMMLRSPLFGLNLNLSFSNLISSGVNFFDNLRKKTPTTPQSSATDSSSPRWVYWCFV